MWCFLVDMILYWRIVERCVAFLTDKRREWWAVVVTVEWCWQLAAVCAYLLHVTLLL